MESLKIGVLFAGKFCGIHKTLSKHDVDPAFSLLRFCQLSLASYTLRSESFDVKEVLVEL